MRRYCFIRYIFFVYASPLLGRFPFYRFPIQYLLFTPNPCFYANIPCYLGFYSRYRAWCNGGRERGVPCVDRRRLQPLQWCYPVVQFNLPSRSPILDPSPAPVPVGDWEAELRGSSVSRTSQQRLQCAHFPIPVLAKGFLPFFLP